MKKVLRKILFIFLPSIFVVFVILEIGLRIAGNLYALYRSPDTYAWIENSNREKFNVLCLGDSFTFGAGTSPDNSYPRQLGRLLRRNINKDINVINAGRPGNTSSLLLKNFRKDIALYNPDIAIVMIGCNNFWNFEDSSYFVLYKDKANYFEKLDNILSRLRVYKFIKIGYLNFENNKSNNLKKVHAGISKRSLRFSTLGTELFLEGRYVLTKEILNKAVISDKNNYKAHLWLAHIYNARSEFKKGRKELWKAIGIIDEWNNDLVYDVICRFPEQKDFMKTKKELNKFKRYIKAKYLRNSEKEKSLIKLIDARLDSLEDRQISQRVLEYDLEKIISLANSKGVTLILQTYPHDGLSLYDVFHKISNKFDIPLVDNLTVFKEIEKHSNIEDFFVPDKHCNDKGYRVIAQNTYNALVKYRILPEDEGEKPGAKKCYSKLTLK